MNHPVSQSLSESGSDDPETEHDGARTDGATGEASEPEPEVKEGRERAACWLPSSVQRKKGVQLVMEWRRPLFRTRNEV